MATFGLGNNFWERIVSNFIGTCQNRTESGENKEQRKKSKNKLRRLCTGRSNDLKKPRIHMKNRMKVAMRTLKSNIFNSAKKSGKTWAVIKSPVKSKKSLAILGTSLVVTGGGVVLWNNYYMPL